MEQTESLAHREFKVFKASKVRKVTRATLVNKVYKARRGTKAIPGRDVQ